VWRRGHLITIDWRNAWLCPVAGACAKAQANFYAASLQRFAVSVVNTQMNQWQLPGCSCASLNGRYQGAN
jgi:hypothetical protein